jgi:hypothetical protein
MHRVLALTLCAASGCYAGAPGFDPAADGGSDDTGGTEAGSDAGDDESSDGDTGDDGEPSEGSFGRAGLRRLTRAQLANSLRDLLGAPIAMPTGIDHDLLPGDIFTTVSGSKKVSESQAVDAYEAMALDVAHQVFSNPDARAALVGCDPTSEESCAETFLAAFGRRAFRRPLADDELGRYVALVDEAAPGDPWLGLELTVAGMIQSPSFLYLVEVGEPDPEAPSRLRYTDYEMAGRLAGFLWASAPDDALLDAAAAGQLLTDEGLTAQVDRMLADPRADAAISGFFSELLHLDVVETLTKDATLYPEASSTLFAAMRGEALRIIDALVLQGDADLRSLFDTRQTFVTAELAQLYGMPAPDPALADAEGFAPATIPEGWERIGFFGTAVFLAGNATVERTSPTRRGFYLQERFRCFKLPPPPADVDAELPDLPDGVHMTMRDRLEQHREDPSCAGCHGYVDPIGLGLEHFDGLGRHREDDQGLDLDVSGDVEGQAFEGLPGLAAVLRDDPNTMRCMARQAYRFATGHEDGATEVEILDALVERFSSSGHRFRGLARELVLTEGFRYFGVPQE